MPLNPTYVVQTVGKTSDDVLVQVAVSDAGSIMVDSTADGLLTKSVRSESIQLEILTTLKIVCLQLSCLTGEDITPADIGEL